jgi:glutamate formiminotransferase
VTAEIVECVVNVSEGRNEVVLAEFADAAGTALLDLHRDPDHHRSVFTLAGPPELVAARARSLAATVVATLDLRGHDGVHPRLGVLDVVPFVPYRPGARPPTDLTRATELRDDFGLWLATELGVPVFVFGPGPGGSDRTLPEVRRNAFRGLVPDHGPREPDPRSGASAVGARRVLVAYNLWVSSLEIARTVAAAVRSREVRALGLALGSRAQVSCNLVEPLRVGPADLYDEVFRQVRGLGGSVLGAELVGLLPGVVLKTVPRSRHTELGLSDDTTVEARLPH